MRLVARCTSYSASESLLVCSAERATKPLAPPLVFGHSSHCALEGIVRSAACCASRSASEVLSAELSRSTSRPATDDRREPRRRPDPAPWLGRGTCRGCESHVCSSRGRHPACRERPQAMRCAVEVGARECGYRGRRSHHRRRYFRSARVGGDLFGLPFAAEINMVVDRETLASGRDYTALIKGKCDPTSTNSLGDTPLCCALRKGAPPVVIQGLFGVRASANISDHDGVTPLLTASRNEDLDLDIVPMLLRADASPNANDRFGETPLMEAAGLGNVNLCQTLLDARASISTQSNEFKLTAMDFAEDAAVSELFHRVLAASVTTDLPTSAQATSTEPKLFSTIAGSCRNSVVGVVPDVAVRPSRSSALSSEGTRQFEWVNPFGQARSLRKERCAEEQVP